MDLGLELPLQNMEKYFDISTVADPMLIDKVNRFIQEHMVVLHNRVDAVLYLDSSEEIPMLPLEYSDVLIKGKGLTLKIGKDLSGEVIWEIHFGIRGLNNKQRAQAEGIGFLQTFGAMIEDMSKLKQVLEKNPQIEPELIVGGNTNKDMYNFLRRKEIGLVIGIIPDTTSEPVEGSPLRQYYLMDKERFKYIIHSVNPTLDPRDNLKRIAF